MRPPLFPGLWPLHPRALPSVHWGRAGLLHVSPTPHCPRGSHTQSSNLATDRGQPVPYEMKTYVFLDENCHENLSLGLRSDFTAF